MPPLLAGLYKRYTGGLYRVFNLKWFEALKNNPVHLSLAEMPPLLAGLYKRYTGGLYRVFNLKVDH